MDRVTEAIYTDPHTSAHIWYFGYGEMIFTAVFCAFTIHDFKPWTEQGFSQWNLGQILVLVTLAPTGFELVVSFGGFFSLSFFLSSQPVSPLYAVTDLVGGERIFHRTRDERNIPPSSQLPRLDIRLNMNSKVKTPDLPVPNPRQKSGSKKR